MKKIFQPVMIILGGMAGLAYKAIAGAPSCNPKYLSIIAQIMVAYVIVAGADISTMRTLPALIPVAVVYSLVLLVISFAMAWLCSLYIGIDLFTALFAMPPGGLSGLGLAAAEVGANAPVVILFHLIRIVIVVLTVPVVAKIVCR